MYCSQKTSGDHFKKAHEKHEYHSKIIAFYQYKYFEYMSVMIVNFVLYIHFSWSFIMKYHEGYLA